MSSLNPHKYGLDTLQKISMSLMGILVLITFIGANLQAVFWQSSNWLVSTVLPAVVVDLTNQERADISAQPLLRSSVLDAAAKMKAEDMAKNQYFAHFSPAGVSPWYWFDKSGYVYAHAGENLAIHFTDSSEVVEAWMKSPAHKENIVNGKYTEIGVGTAKGKFEGFDTIYVVQLFGTPAVAPVPKVIEPPVRVVKAVPAEEVSKPMVVESNIVETPVIQPAEEVSPVVVKNELVLEQSEVSVESSDNLQELRLLAVDSQIKDNVLIPEAEIEDIKPVRQAEKLVVSEVKSSVPEDVFVYQIPSMSTSSGLAVANMVTPNNVKTVGIASVATQPNLFLQSVYMILGFLVLVLLTVSIVVEVRRLHYAQVAYGLVLIFSMGGLWFVNSLLTSGAVIL